MTDDGPSSFVTVARKLQLPNEVHQTYENNGVKKLYDWQLECLFCTGVLDGKNLVYCAPTSGGKTLISELVLLRNVLILRKRAVFVLPYVSLVLEKTKYFKKLLKSYNNTKSISEKIIVKAYYGDVTGKKGFKGHIIICTIEKANSVINSIIINSCTNTIGCLIIDEMHILGDQFNGYLLEILISKFRLLEIKSRNSIEHCKIQLIGMSATVGNVKFLANWFGGSLFITGFRPVPLVEYIIADNIIYDIHGTELSVLNLVYSANKDNVDKNKELSLDSSSIQLMSLVYEGLYLRGQQCLIFCPTKFSCQTTANMLSSELQVVIDKSEDNMNKSITYSSCKLNNMKLVEARNHYIDKIKKSNELVDIHLLKSIANGIAYHHSGLTSDIKAIIEDAFYKGIICALCATTTLAAGVNLPAGRVIIRSLTIGRDNLLVTQYKQMCGRAGRAGQSIYGESFLLVKKNELLKAIELVNNTLPNVVSQVHPSKDDGRAILKALLEMISLQLIKTVHDVKIYIEQTLMYQESLSINQADDLVKLIYESLLFLIDAQAININYNHTEIFLDLLMSDHFQDKILTCSRFGKAITVSGLNPDEAIIMYKDLLQAETGFNLETSLHLTYIITPLDHKNQPDFKALLSWYDKAICRKNSPDAVFIKTMSLEQSYGLLNKWSYDTPPVEAVNYCVDALRCLSLKRHDQKTQLTSIIKGKNIPLILRKYNVNEWETLAKWKRVWTAIVLNHALDERISSIESVATRFQLEISDLEGLLYSGKIVASKLQQFCQEIGHNQVAVLIKEYKSNFDKDISTELKPLLIIPSMNLKIARVLYDTLHITNLNDLLNTSTEKIVYQCYLSSGFVLNEEDINDKSSNSVITKDHLYRQQIIDWVVKITNFAKTVISDSMNAAPTNKITQIEPIIESILDAATFQTSTSDVDSSSSDDEGMDDDNDETVSVIQEIDDNFEDQNDEDSNMPFYAITRSDNILDNNMNGILTPKLICKNNHSSTGTFQSPVPTISLVLESVKGSVEAKLTSNNTPLCPLLTPLLQSSHKSGSKFLYLSQVNHDATLRSMDYDVIPLGQEECSKPNFSRFAEDVCDIDKTSFIWKHISKDTSCQSFLKELGTCKVVSFELVFSKLPGSKQKSGSSLSRWLESIAFSCPRTSSSTFGGVSTIDCLGINGGRNERCMLNDPNVICGIALCFGSDTSYYMPLPVLPPQLLYDGIKTIDTDNYLMVGSLDSLPIKVKEKIARYVGFDLILCKCPYLKSRTSKYVIDKDAVASIISKPSSCHLDHCSNPLMSLNKSWAMASRSALRKEWRKGSCIEWQILNEIMNNKGVTKIALDIKSQLLCLRERDIIVNGPLEDPNIAALLLPTVFQLPSIIYEKELLNMQKLRIPKPSISINTENRSKSLFEPYRQSCFRAIAVFRLMVKYTDVLRKFGLLDLYRGVEMPLHISVIDAEYSGVPIQPNFFAIVRQDLTDRQNVISLHLKRINNEKNINLSDYTVVNGLKVAIKNKLVSCLERQSVSNDIFTHQKSLKLAEERLLYHPLIKLIDEYRVNEANILICNSILKHKYTLRTRAVYNTIGSATGRISLSNPNTQAIPHESLYSFTNRNNIYNEYLTIAEEKRSGLLHNINNELLNGKIIWVKVIETEFNLTSPREFIKRTVAGRLMKLLDFNKNNKPSITTANIDMIHAIVECNYTGAVITAPCTQVYRLDSSLLANDEEVKNISNSLENGIIEINDQTIKPATVSLRWGFQAEDGNTFISFDYKQIELRLMAHFSDDTNLINLFKSDKDIFMSMASKWKNKDISDITVKERDEIKHICYGLLYGAGKKLLAEHLECSIEEAILKYNNFLLRFPLLKVFMEDTKDFCRTYGYVKTLLGRRCYYKDINDDDPKVKSKAERQCINSIVQGSAADLIKLAMINVHSELMELSRKTNTIKFRAKRIYPGGGLYKRLDDVRLCMSIHDELIYEVPKEPEMIGNLVGLIKETMENNILHLKVPLRVKVRCGDVWGDLQEINNDNLYNEI